MRKLFAILSLTAVATLGACQKTGEGEYQAQVPNVDVDVNRDTATIRTPSVDAGVVEDTVIVKRPTVDVETPAERRGEPKRDTSAKRP